MKKLVVDILIVLLMLVGIDISIAKIGNYLLEHVEDTSFYGEIKYAITEITPDVLIVGASRAKSHYVPQVFIDSLHKTVYNAGSDGKNIFYHSCIINAVIKRKVPDMIILELAAQEFQWNVYDRLSVLNPFYNHDSLITATVNLKSKTEWVKMKSNLYRYNSILPTLINNVYKKGEHKSYGYRNLPYGGKMPELKPMEILEEPIDTNSVNRVLYVVNVCKTNYIPLILAISPYYGYLPEETTTIQMLKKICKQYNLPFLNYSQSSYFLQHPEYFRDVNHLNHKGAEVYTKLIIENVKKVL
jgi:hypothetical protein